MISKQGLTTVLIPTTLALLLVVIHAPALNLGFHLRGFDRLHDFWGGLLVEMIGVAIEIALIIFVLTTLEERRWKPVRRRVNRRIESALLKEISEFNSMTPNQWEDLRRVHTFLVTKRDNAKDRLKELSDFLQFTNNSFTPEMSHNIASLMSKYRLFILQHQSAINLAAQVTATPNASTRRVRVLSEARVLHSTLALIVNDSADLFDNEIYQRLSDNIKASKPPRH